MSTLTLWIETVSTWNGPVRIGMALLVKSTIVLALALAAAALLRRASAATRHLVLAVGLAASLLLPLARLALPPISLAWLPVAQATEQATPVPTRPAATSALPTAPAEPRATVPPTGALASAGRSVPHQRPFETALLVAGIVSALLTLYLVLGIVRVRLLGRNATEPEPGSGWWRRLDEARAAVGLRRPVGLALSERVRVPLTQGFVRPVVLLPTEAADWTPEGRRAVLLHELGHVRRGDWLVQIAARLLCSLYWFHPLVWIATAKLLVEAERACDDVVLGQGEAGPGYARQLLELATIRRRELPVFGAVAMARRATLSERIQAILDPAQSRCAPGRAKIAGVAAVALATVVLLAPARLVHADSVDGLSPDPETAAADSDRDSEVDADLDLVTNLDDALGGDLAGPLAEGIREGLDDDSFARESLEGLAEEGSPPLLSAAARGDHDAARRLLADGANPNEGLSELGTPLIVAAVNGDPTMVSLLLDGGASPNLSQMRRRLWPQLPRSPLGAAARSGNADVVDRLLAAGAEVDFAPRGDAPPLSIAARHRHLEVAARLLAHGADPGRVTKGDGTPLIEAVRGGDPRIVQLLLDAGADPDTWVDGDESALYHAVVTGNLTIVDQLLDQGADPNAEWKGDGTPLRVAIASGQPAVVDRLLESGARGDVGVPGDNNALMEAAEAGETDLLRRMLDAGADPNAAVEGDGNALIVAAKNGRLEAVRLLVQRGADIDRVVPGDENPLIQAAANGRYDVVKFLLDAGADPNLSVEVESWRGGTEVRTALGQALRNGHDRVAELLRKHGATDPGQYPAPATER